MANPTERLFALLDRELWLVTACMGPRRGGLIATFVSAASIVPELPRVLVGIAHSHCTWELLEASGAFGLHLLGEENLDWVWRFGMRSGRDGDKFDGLSVTTAAMGSPIVNGAIGWFDCRVEERFEIGDRTLFLGEVVAARAERAGVPLMERKLISMANDEQRAELKRQRDADGLLDERAIRAWRARVGNLDD